MDSHLFALVSNKCVNYVLKYHSKIERLSKLTSLKLENNLRWFQNYETEAQLSKLNIWNILYQPHGIA